MLQAGNGQNGTYYTYNQQQIPNAIPITQVPNYFQPQNTYQNFTQQNNDIQSQTWFQRNNITSQVPSGQYYALSNPMLNFQTNLPQNLNTSTNQSEKIAESDMEQSEEDDDNSVNKWQKVKGGKRKRRKKSNDQPTNNENQSTLTIANKYSSLSNTDNNSGLVNKETITPAPDIPKPPPIFVHGVMNYDMMTKTLLNVAETEQYTTKCLADNVVKINTKTPDVYRKLIKYMQENDIIHHTFQMKQDRPYKVVMKHIHHTTPTEEIKNALKEKGHKVRNILNIKNKHNNEPMPIFFIDLEPSENNKDIYDVRAIDNKHVLFEPPRKNTEIAQCTRCQNYGHTRAYCNRPYACVKCAGPHDTKTCTKPRSTPATCILCEKPHPANYKGCTVYQELQKKYNPHRQPPASKPFQIIEHNFPLLPNQQNNQPLPNQPSSSRPSYAHNLKQHPVQNQDLSLQQFLNEFKNMFSQLIQQNSMILNMLTTVINKIIL